MRRNLAVSRGTTGSARLRRRFSCDDLRPLRARLRSLELRPGRASGLSSSQGPRADEPLRERSDGTGAELAVLPPRRERIRQTYLDTPDRTILRAGCALALRATRGGARAVLQPHSPAANDASAAPVPTERTAATGVEALSVGTGPVARRLRWLRVRPGDLEPLFEVRTVRESFRVLRSGLAEGTISLERTELAQDAGGAPLLATVVEPDAGAEGGPAAAAARLVDLLRSLTGADLEIGPEPFDWALARRGLAPPAGPDLGSTAVSAGMTSAETAFAVLRRHAASFLRHELGARLGDDPEHVHDMRVATRRMRAALRIFAEALPAEESERLREELREAGRVLGRVRDLDVQLAQMREWAGKLVSVPPQAAEALLDGLHRDREEARRELLAYLDSRRFQRLRSSLVRRLRRGPDRQRSRGAPPPGAALPIVLAGPRWVRRARRRVLRAGDRIRATSPPSDYHELRIRCKRFRYALEFLEPLHGPPARRLIEALVEVQDILGQHQDAQVALAFLRESVRARRRLRAESLAAAGELAQVVSALAARLRREFPKAYRRLRGKRWKEWKRAARAAALDQSVENPAAGGGSARSLVSSLAEVPPASGPVH